MKQGFVKGTSENLPNVNLDMLLSFASQNECYSGAEMRGVKTMRSMRANYGDEALGYVQLLRRGSLCIVKAKICPEHKLRNKNYTVTVEVDESEETVLKAKCHDCAACLGGCKHAIALLTWIYRRSQEKSRTSVACYWSKPKLSDVGINIKFMKIRDMIKSSENANENTNENQDKNMTQDFLSKVLNYEKKDKVKKNSHLIKFFQKSSFVSLSLHHSAVLFNGDKQNPKEFLFYHVSWLTPNNCHLASTATVNQCESNLWYELRYARITASVVYEAAQCKIFDGSLVEKILGLNSFDNLDMERGRRLENHVLEKVSKSLEVKLKKCGLLLNQQYPVFGASPDAVSDDAVFEVKCPKSEKTSEKYYYSNGKVKNKVKAQLHIQKIFANKCKDYLCIADPEFEKNMRVRCIVENLDKNFINAVMKRALFF